MRFSEDDARRARVTCEEANPERAEPERYRTPAERGMPTFEEWQDALPDPDDPFAGE